MTEVRFDTEDVVDVRFAVSPLWETVAGLWAVGEPERHAVHLPWSRPARALLRRPELARRVAPLRDLVGPGSCLPDFLTPPPVSALGEIEQELAVVAATPADRVRAELAGGPASPFARQLATDVPGRLPELVDAVRLWWRAAVEPHWPRMRALLEADIAHRTRQFSAGGVRALFGGLHPGARWAGDRLVVDDRLDTVLGLGGRGLPLLPSVFADRCVLLTSSATAPPVAIYPARAVGTLWERQEISPDGLARLLGRSRARVLALTTSPSTTTQLAARTGLSLGAVSQHLGVLRASGLVTGHRYRHEVHYTATEFGAALLDRSQPDGAGALEAI
ncbi:helix-turn-helix domain-containing protein [Kitasatospora sp. NPDC097643]|uniref:helix-turn-helix domain-containing protein n=1 Tax=Kitasatospora sp. NPDC097643 TaxID=3157230 RepID=UPI00333017DE